MFKAGIFVVDANSFNRTFMELKFHVHLTDGIAFLRFNRTFMELKYF